MKQIKLNVEEHNLETVLTILKNLKTGLISSIESDDVTLANTRYQPKSNRVIPENEKPQGKYLSAASYKARIEKSGLK